MEERQVRRATLDDASWIVELSARVQAALTASGSLQIIGPLPLETVERSISSGHACVLETAERRIGSVLIDPAEHLPDDKWKLHTLPTPLWYLHALMLEPQEQSKGAGLVFLEGIKRLMAPEGGTIVLDCWAGNAKLRDFYHRAGFTFHGVFPAKDYEIAVFFFVLRHHE
jgi:GNAT superfamily N-acetyltransferase